MEYGPGIRVLNNWEIVDELGEGSYGKVFRIKKVQNNVTFEAALKVIRIPKSASDVKALLFDGMDEKTVTSYFKDYVDRLIREIAIMAALKGHSNVVSCEDYALIAHEGKIGWDILMQMELLTPFPEYQMKHHMDEAEVITLAKDICAALSYCHRQHGLIHRDVKPSNLFVDKSGHFKLGDFGVSRIIEGSIGNFSRQGTDMYMAPEVYKNQPYGETVDIYSLGIMLYRMMNNKRFPFYPQTGQMPEFAEREEAFIRRMKGETLAAPVNASAAFSDIILRACAYEPKNRYSSAGQMLEELKQLDYTFYFHRSIPAESIVNPKDADGKPEISPVADEGTSVDEKTSYMFQPKQDKKREDHSSPPNITLHEDKKKPDIEEILGIQEVLPDSIEDSLVASSDEDIEQRQKSEEDEPQYRYLLITIMVAIVLALGVHGLQLPYSESTDEADKDYESGDPYEFVESELPTDQYAGEYMLEMGEYVVGVHIPSGNYTAEPEDDFDVVGVDDRENGIYLYEYRGKAGENYLDDLRLYPGARVTVSADHPVRFSTENGDAKEMRGIENPLTEQTVIGDGEKAGEDFEAGVYDVFVAEGYCSATLIIYDEKGEEYKYRHLYFSESSKIYRNLVFPENACLEFNEGEETELTLIPSEKIESTDYMGYYIN